MNRGGNIEDRMALMDVMSQNTLLAAPIFSLSGEELEQLHQAYLRVLAQKQALEMRVRKSEARRRALMHILTEYKKLNNKLDAQRKTKINLLPAHYLPHSRPA